MGNPIPLSRSFQGCELNDNTHLNILRDDLLRYCDFLSGSRHEAEDLVQTTLLKALPMLEQQSHPNTSALLRRIAKNTWIDHVRKQNKYCLHSPDEFAAIGGSVWSAQSSELELAMQVLIQRLTPQQRAVFLLSAVFEYTDQETAELLGTSRGAVKAALHRARLHLGGVPRDVEIPSFRDESQRDLLKAYVSAFHAGNVRALIHLCDAGVLNPVQAVSTIHTFTQRQTQTRHSSYCTHRSMILAA